MSGAVLWVIIAAVLIVIEITTVQLVCVWFAVGSLFAGLACFVGAPVWLQLLICLVSSVAVLIVGRPLLLDKITPKKQPTNADRIIGQPGIVEEEIDNLKQTGRVSANGLSWAARSEGGEIIPPGIPVLVLRIDGVKLIVRQVPEEYLTLPRPLPPEEEAGPGEREDSPPLIAQASSMVAPPSQEVSRLVGESPSIEREPSHNSPSGGE